MPATATKKRQSKSSKSKAPAAKASKSKPAAKPAVKPSAKPAKASKAKPAFVPPTAEEQAASDEKFYSTVAAHGIVIDNPRTGKRISRSILQAHVLAHCWPSKPMTAAQIAADATLRFGVRITEARVNRQLVDEIRTGRVVAKGKGFVKTDVVANRWSQNGSDE